MRFSLLSVHSISPWLFMASAMSEDFPPGAAQASKMTSPAVGASSSTQWRVAGS